MLIVVCWFTCAKSTHSMYVCVSVYGSVSLSGFVYAYLSVCVLHAYVQKCKFSLGCFTETTNCRVGRFRWGPTKKTNCLNYNIYYTRTSSIVKKSILFYDTSSLFGAASIRYVCMYIHILLSDFIEYFGKWSEEYIFCTCQVMHRTLWTISIFNTKFRQF